MYSKLNLEFLSLIYSNVESFALRENHKRLNQFMTAQGGLGRRKKPVQPRLRILFLALGSFTIYVDNILGLSNLFLFPLT